MNNNTSEDIKTYSSVGEYVYAEIRRQIINWKLKPGQRISEAEMSKVLNVSRTPVREGFIRLKNEGLVEILAQRGTIISKIDLKKVKEGVFIRKCLEREVIREIAGKMSNDSIKKGRKYLLRQEEALIDEDYIKFHEYDILFHKLFFEEADKVYTWKMLQLSDTQYDRVRMLTLLDFNKFSLLIKDHTGILDAVIEGDFNRASKDMDYHIDLVFKEIEVLEKEYANYFIDGE